MRSALLGLAVAALVLVVVLVGLQSSEAPSGLAGPALYDHVTARYAVSSPTRDLGVLEFSLDREGARYMGEVRFEHAEDFDLDGAPDTGLVVINATAVAFNASTGERAWTQYDNRTEFPWGTAALMPTPWQFLEVGPNNIRIVLRPADLLPIGPQWAVLGKQAGTTWGELRVASKADTGSWLVSAVGACNTCLLDEAHDFTTTMRGKGGEMLPTRVVLSYDGQDYIELDLLAAIQSKPSERIVAEPGVFMAHGRACGFAPCEPPGWPVRLSLQYGLEALAQDPLWTSWRTFEAEIFPCFLNVGFRSMGAATVISWAFVFRGSTSDSLFELSSVEVGGQGVTRPAVDNFDLDYHWPTSNCSLDTDRPWKALDEIISGRNVMDDGFGGFDQIQVIGDFGHMDSRADDRVLFFSSQCTLRASLVGGNPMEMSGECAETFM